MCELLSFKFNFYISSNNEEGEVTPRSLYLVTALLIQHDIMKLEDVYPLVSPGSSSKSADLTCFTVGTGRHGDLSTGRQGHQRRQGVREEA